MLGLTRIKGVPDSSEAKPGMAFFEGTGPQDKRCGDCHHRGYYRETANGKHRKVLACQMFKKLSGRHGPPIDRNWHACKYFEQKPGE
jgi:hypothetical protein